MNNKSMKKVIFYTLIGILISCQNKKTDAPITDVEEGIEIENLEKRAFEAYSKEPSSAIVIFDSLSHAYAEANNLAKQAITELNIANIYDEHEGKFVKANYHAHKSLALWETLRDTIQMANLLKYSGYINGVLGNFEIGKRQIDKAIEFYTLKRFEAGKAVSYLNMAKVIYYEGNYKSCEQFFRLAKSFWSKENDKGRVIGINNFGIDLYTKLNDEKMVSDLKSENKVLLEN